PEELEHAAVRLGRLRSQVVAREHEHLLARKERQPALDLIGVPSPRQIRVVPPGVAEVTRLAHEALLLSSSPLRLRVDCLLEREWLTPERDLVVVVGERAVDG